MLIFYRANWITFSLFLIFKTIKNVGWPNLLAGEELVPELIQLENLLKTENKTSHVK